MGARYGMSPIEVWETFPMRIILRCYSLIWKDRMKFRFFLAMLAGSDSKEPDWSEYDKSFKKKKTEPLVEKGLDDPYMDIVEREGKRYKVVRPGTRPIGV